MCTILQVSGGVRTTLLSGCGFGGDGGPVGYAKVNGVVGLAVDSAANLYLVRVARKETSGRYQNSVLAAALV